METPPVYGCQIVRRTTLMSLNEYGVASSGEDTRDIVAFDLVQVAGDENADPLTSSGAGRESGQIPLMEEQF